MSTALPSSATPLTFPPMGCGTWAWGNRLLWDYRPAMDQALQDVFNTCVQQGITLFDTGDSYGTGTLKGRSESLLGQFQRHYTGPNASAICLATKLAPYPWRLTRSSMIQACTASADRLGRPVDLVQLHWSTANYAPWQEWALLDGLGELYTQGLVKGVGLSNFGPKRLQKVWQHLHDRGVPIVSLQVQYSLLSTYPVTELDLKALCDELGIKLIAYSPLALGLLTDKYRLNGPLPKGLRGFLCGQLLPRMASLLGCLRTIAISYHKTPAQVALNWCICKGTIPIPGAKSLTQAQENGGAIGWHLSPAEVDELDRVAARVPKKMVQNIFQTL